MRLLAAREDEGPADADLPSLPAETVLERIFARHWQGMGKLDPLEDARALFALRSSFKGRVTRKEKRRRILAEFAELLKRIGTTNREMSNENSGPRAEAIRGLKDDLGRMLGMLR